MSELARLMVRGRIGQVAALAVTVLFATTLVGAFGLLLETGLRGQVGTGEYAEAPVLLGASQDLPVSGDADVPVTGRALLDAELVDELRSALPVAQVVADRIVPATLVGADGAPQPVDLHPWPATALGARGLAGGQPPAAVDHLTLPSHLAGDLGVDLGHVVELGFGDEARPFTVSGLTTNDDDGVDVPDFYLTADAIMGLPGASDRVAVVGIWPSSDEDLGALDRIAARHDARTWDQDERGRIEVVAQGPANALLVSAAGAFGVLAAIIAVFTLITLVGLQLRERSRELAMLRVVGATPAQVRRLLLTEVRRVALIASLVGGIGGPVLGSVLVAVIRSIGVLPAELQPVFGPLPFLVPFLLGTALAEIATRGALRRSFRGSATADLGGGDDGISRQRGRRTVVGVAVLLLGVVMAGAPWYASGEPASALPALSGLVVALSFGSLAPFLARAAVATARRLVGRSSTAYLAVHSMASRPARVGGVLAPVALGVAIACVQLLSATTVGAIARDQVNVGARADLVVSAPVTGVGAGTADAVRAVAGVQSAEPVMVANVVARGDLDDGSWQILGAVGIAGDAVDRYADLQFLSETSTAPGEGEVALGMQGAAMLEVQLQDTVTIVLPDGRRLTKLVSSLYHRGLGFGEVLLPRGELQPSAASGQPTGLAVTLEDAADVADTEARLHEVLVARPGVEVSRTPVVEPPAAGSGEGAFQVLLLLILFGYVAIAVANSLVTATLSRRSEFALLRAVGATPSQRRAVPRWEAVVIATAGGVAGTLAALPGLGGMAYALSDGERLLPAVPPLLFATIMALTFALVLTATALPARAALR